ncbi:hypothetical protein ACWELJ_32630 [Nocardia sp. NPDC004582]
MTTHGSSSWTVSFNAGAAEHLVDWLVRELPAAALRAVGESELADQIAALPAVTAEVMRGGLHVYPPLLRRASLMLPGDAQPPERWQTDAAMYTDIGSAAMDVAHDVELGLIENGHYAGFWGLQVVCNAYLRSPADTTAQVQQCYQRLVDAAVLNGWGRLTS